MPNKDVTRRDFLSHATAFGLAALGSSAFLAACGGGGETGGGGAATETPAPEAQAPAAEESAMACDDLSGLADADIQMRQTLQYVDKSEFPDKTCANCQLFKPPEGDAVCGGCQIIKGPIAPGGHCTSWAAKVS